MRKKDWKRVVTTAIAATMCVGTFNVFGGETQTTEIDWYSSVAGWGPAGWKSGVTDSPLTSALKEKFGITLNIEQPPTDADTKLGLMIATGDLPDSSS